MATVPVYDSQLEIKPTEIDPKVAGTGGAEIVDLSEGLKGIGQKIQKLDDQRQTLKAQTALAKSHRDIHQMALTDPDLDGLDEKIGQKSDEAITSAAELIKSNQARQSFIASANLDIERRNIPTYNAVIKRKSQDFKNELVQANDADIQEYQSLADPGERKLLRQRVLDRTSQAIQDGHVNADWAKAHAKTLLDHADINQVNSDMAVDATHTYEQLQKGDQGLYPYLKEGQRKTFMDKAQRQITKTGSDNRLIYSTAQNQAENQLVDKMASNSLTQDDINNAELFGMKGIRVRPEFAKAARQALDEPFPTDSVPDKYNKLVAQVQDPDSDPIETKLNVLTARGITPQQKAHLLTAHLREDNQEGKQSINDLISKGIKQNRQSIMEADKNLKKELNDRKSFFRGITSMFRNHAQDDKHLAQLQQEYFNKVQNSKDMDERLSMANEVLNRDTLLRNPKINTADPKGTVFQDAQGRKRIYYPNGHWEPLKK